MTTEYLKKLSRNGIEYLGDGVYARVGERGHAVLIVMLTTKRSFEITNQIVLRPKALAAFMKYVAKVKKEKEKKATK